MSDLQTTLIDSYRAIERGAWDALDSLFTADCEMVDPAATCTSLDEMKDSFAAYHQAFSDLRFEVSHVEGGGDTVVAESTITGVHSGALPTPDGELPASGRPIAVRVCEVVRFRDGRICSSHIYYDQTQLLSQLGVLDDAIAATG